MIDLIKQINEELEQTIATDLQETATAVAIIESNIVGFDKTKELFETAEEFLMQLSAMVGAGKVDPAQIDRYASELAALQLLSQQDTAGALLSRFKGDPKQNLATIVKGVAKPSDTPGKLDQLLIQVAQQNGKSLSDTNKQTLSQLAQMGDQQKQQFVQTLQKLAVYFRQVAGTSAQPQNQQATQQNAQTPAVAGSNPQGMPGAGAGAPPSV